MSGKSKQAGVVRTEDDLLFKSVFVSCREEADERGRKEYRTVFAGEEMAVMYVDAEWNNKRHGEHLWEAEVITGLFRMNGEKAEPVAQKTEKVTVPEETDVFLYSTCFRREELPGGGFPEGVYGVVVQVNGIAEQSDTIVVMEGKGVPGDYFRLIQAGVDRDCEETEEEAKKRTHSYSCLNVSQLKDVRFYLMAENLLEREWIYEFVLFLSRRNGLYKATRMVKASQYIQDSNGKSYLCFGVDLGGEIKNFWKEGEYTLRVVAFGCPVVSLDFMVGTKDIPYDYAAEVAAGNAGVMLRNSFLNATVETKDKEHVLDTLYRLVGLRKVKEEITRICEYADFIKMRRENGFSDTFPAMHMLFTGRPGAGINTVAEIIGELFCSMGILSHGKVTHCGRRELVQDGVPEEQLVRKAIAGSLGGVLFIGRAGEFYSGNGSQDRGLIALGILLEILIREKPEVLVILSDDSGEIEALQDVLPAMNQCFTKRLYFEDYTAEELLEITRNKLEIKQLRFTPLAEEKFLKLLKTASQDKGSGFDGSGFIDERIEDAMMRMARRLMGDRGRKLEKEEMMQITEEDVVVENGTVPGKSFEKLNGIVGEKQLKQSIIHHLNYIYFVRERQKQGFDDVMPPLNMVFSGNPGTGKLTVAKMLGEIYYTAGLLANPAVLVQNARNLAVPDGVSPDQAAAMLLNAANGGILYIEEAGLLTQSASGLALFEMLLASLSPEEFDRMVVVLADTPEEADKMLEANPGLKVYFPYRFDFKDYSPEELLDIAVNKLKEKKYSIHPKALEGLKEQIRKAYGNRDKHFGNAVWIDKLVAAVIRKMSDRTMQIRQERELTRQELTTVMAADIPADGMMKPGFNKDSFDEKEIGEALKELDGMVGQVKIKKQIRDFVELARHYCQQGIKLNTKMSLQWCFTGNSGMGKRAMARIIARLYKAMGIVEKAVVFDFKLEKLIGQTEDEAQRMLSEVLGKARGGVLLFDEDSRKLANADGFRERARAILVSQMAERPGAYMVIYAGQQPTLQSFRSGVEKMSDLINVLFFEDYTNEELMQILKRKLADENMRLTDSARQYVAEFITRLTSTEERNRSSARLMRIVAELMIRNCMQRMAKSGKVTSREGEPVSVVKSDVDMLTEELIANLMDERKRIGFVKS